MRRTKVICMMLGLTILFTSNALAGKVIDRILQKKELVVGISGNQPPLSATSKEGEIIGLDAELAQLMADTMGVKIKFEVMPFSELLPSLQAGKVDDGSVRYDHNPRTQSQSGFCRPVLYLREIYCYHEGKSALNRKCC